MRGDQAPRQTPVAGGIDPVVGHGDSLACHRNRKRIVFADSLPVNPSGKILKRERRVELKDLFAEAFV